MDHLSENQNEPAQEPVPSTDFKQRFKLSALEILFGILILLGLIYIGYFILFQGSSGTGSKLEKKINLMEANSQAQAGKLEKMINAVQEKQDLWEARLKSQEALTMELSTKIGKLEKRQTEVNKLSPTKEKIQYKVKKGETLQSIAKKFKVSADDLARLNKLDKNRPVRVGDTLVISSR